MTIIATETEYEFDLLLALHDGRWDVDAMLDRLFEVGLDDAVVALGLSGLIGLSLTRTAATVQRRQLQPRFAKRNRRRYRGRPSTR